MNNNNDIKIYDLAVIIAAGTIGTIALAAAIIGYCQHYITAALCAVMVLAHVGELKSINKKNNV
jgi:hypothetical protein